MEMDNETDVLFSCQGVISTFKSYDLRNIAVTAIDSGSSDGSEQGKLKTSGKNSHSRDIKNICGSWEEVKISTLTI